MYLNLVKIYEEQDKHQKLLKFIIEKLSFSDKTDQYKLLTCVPDSWSIYKKMEFFEVSTWQDILEN